MSLGPAALGGALVGSCAGSHDSLAKADGGAGVGGTAGTAGTGAATTTSSGGAAGASGGAGGGVGGSGGIVEPAGPTKLTLVNGVVDEDAVRLCFVPYPTGDDSSPWPENGTLAFGTVGEVDLAGSAIATGVDLQVYVISGALGATLGASCAELVGGPASEDAGTDWMATSVGVMPQSVLQSGKSVLLGFAGCAGSPEHTHPVEKQVCGQGYVPGTPNLSLVAVALSRLTMPSKLSLQFVQAAAAMPVVDLSMRAGKDAASPVIVAPDWAPGSIAPYPPWSEYALDDFGVVSQATIEVYNNNNFTTPAHTALLGNVLDQSGISLVDFADGQGFAFVAVGPLPGVGPGPWWHAYQYVALRTGL